MCEPTTISAGLALVAGSIKAGADMSAAASAKTAGQINATNANLAAGDAVARAGYEQMRVRAEAGRVIGAQASGQAASGVQIGSGSTVQLASAARANSNVASQQIAINAIKESIGLRSKASADLTSADQAARAYQMNAVSSIIGGATGAVGPFAQEYLSQPKVPGSGARVPGAPVALGGDSGEDLDFGGGR